MDQGRIKETGTHEELMNFDVTKISGGEILSGWYKDLWETQHGKNSDQGRLDDLEEQVRKLTAELAAAKAEPLRSLKAFSLGRAKNIEAPDVPALPSLLRGISEGSKKMVEPPPSPNEVCRAVTTPTW